VGPHVRELAPAASRESRVTAINRNTARAGGSASIHEDIDLGQAEAWDDERGDEGWQSWNEVPNWPPALQALQDKEVTLKTSCFEMQALVNIGSSVLSMYSLLDRSNGPDSIITRYRTFGLD